MIDHDDALAELPITSALLAPDPPGAATVFGMFMALDFLGAVLSLFGFSFD